MPNEASPDTYPSARPRELTAPTVLWSLPVVLLSSTTLGWWNVVSIVLVVVGCVALIMIHAKAASSGAVARQAMGAR